MAFFNSSFFCPTRAGQEYLFISLKKLVKTLYIKANCYLCVLHSFKIDPCTPKRKIPSGAIFLAH